MRMLIAGMKLSLDGRITGPDGYADWVQGWSDDYGLTAHVDACVLGAGMYPGYEQYWTAIQHEPEKPLPMTGTLPTPGEVEWARFAAQTPHYVLSSTLTSTHWPKTSVVRSVDDIRALKQQPGKDIYLIGGARTITNLIDAGLVDEIRLIVYPLIAGGGKTLFAEIARRHRLNRQTVRQLHDGRVHLIYGIGLGSTLG